jgi:hypothetical protein
MDNIIYVIINIVMAGSDNLVARLQIPANSIQLPQSTAGQAVAGGNTPLPQQEIDGYLAQGLQVIGEKFAEKILEMLHKDGALMITQERIESILPLVTSDIDQLIGGPVGSQFRLPGGILDVLKTHTQTVREGGIIRLALDPRGSTTVVEAKVELGSTPAFIEAGGIAAQGRQPGFAPGQTAVGGAGQSNAM